jgi:nitrogen fixation/metabolism regulation signal transduction histidine kinase
MTPPARGPTHENRVFLLALGAAAPAALVALVLLWTGAHTLKVQATLSLVVVVAAAGFAFAVRERILRPLQTLANLLAALREGDFSIRGRYASREDALATAMDEVNALGDTLRSQRIGALEAAALLEKVMSEIDVGVFAFDSQARLRLVNRGGERLLGGKADDLLGKPAAALELGDLLAGEAPRIIALPGRPQGQWELRRGVFRQGGRPHTLVVLTDVARALREQERQAWQRLVRVLGHEINNSLTPISSIAGNLRDALQHEPRAGDLEEDLARGLAVIERRAAGLTRFMTSYARLAGLPRPRPAPLDVGGWIRRVTELDKRVAVGVVPGDPITIMADGDQLDQLLINLVRNAVDAALETGGGVKVGWRTANSHVDVFVEDDGPGIADASNLFVPFFTTKPGGSGIGLALSRQIAEAHGGSLTLHNREGQKGCEARLRLPV